MTERSGRSSTAPAVVPKVAHLCPRALLAHEPRQVRVVRAALVAQVVLRGPVIAAAELRGHAPAAPARLSLRGTRLFSFGGDWKCRRIFGGREGRQGILVIAPDQRLPQVRSVTSNGWHRRRCMSRRAKQPHNPPKNAGPSAGINPGDRQSAALGPAGDPAMSGVRGVATAPAAPPPTTAMRAGTGAQVRTGAVTATCARQGFGTAALGVQSGHEPGIMRTWIQPPVLGIHRPRRHCHDGLRILPGLGIPDETNTGTVRN